MKKLLLLIIPAVLIVASLIFSYYSPLLFWGNMTNTPYTNHYQIPDSIPEYQVISTGEKTDWKAHWIWDKENLTEEVYIAAKKMGFLDEVIEKISGKKVEFSKNAVYKIVDTCAAEFEAETPYFYSTYDDEIVEMQLLFVKE